MYTVSEQKNMFEKSEEEVTTAVSTATHQW